MPAKDQTLSIISNVEKVNPKDELMKDTSMYDLFQRGNQNQKSQGFTKLNIDKQKDLEILSMRKDDEKSMGTPQNQIQFDPVTTPTKLLKNFQEGSIISQVPELKLEPSQKKSLFQG